MGDTTGHISSLLPSLDPGLRRDDVVAGNRVLPDGHWLVYCVFRSDAGKDVSTGLNITHAHQQLNYLFRSISPTNFSDEPKIEEKLELVHQSA